MQLTYNSEQRRDGRYRPDRLSCNLGEIVDISGGGMRVLSRRPRRGTQAVAISTARHGRLRLEAKVVWRRQLSPREHVIGLRFDDVPEQVQAPLRELVAEVQRGQSQAGSRFWRCGQWWTGVSLAAAGMALVGLSRLMETPTAWADRWLPEQMPLILESAPLLRWIALAAGGLLLLTGLSEMFGRHPRKLTLDQELAAGQTDRSGTDRRAVAEDARRAQPGPDLAQLHESQQLLNGILESSLGGVAVLRAVREAGRFSSVKDFEIQLINRAAEDLLGRHESQLVGKTLRGTMPCLAKHTIYKDMTSAVGTGLPVQKHYRLDSGRWVQLAVVQLGDGLAVTFADSSEQHHAQARLRHVAYHDELTGLPNRKLLMEHLESALARVQNNPGHRFAVLFLDFDRFKLVNDTLGHEVGDMLLNSISHRLNENIRSRDAAAVAGQFQLPARLGGDEFVVMLDGIAGVADATAVARRLLEVFNQPHQLGSHRVVSTASIGIVVSHSKYDCVDELLRDADTAMYEAKNSGKARYVVFDRQMHEKLLQQTRLEADLREAVEKEDFTLVYEPIVDLASGRVAGFETLVRWEHAERGVVPPADFIPLAEELNLIAPIGEWVLKSACAQLAAWRKMGRRDVFLNVNLSRAQLYDGDLHAVLEELIQTHGLDPSMLNLEITETMVVNDVAEMGRKLTELKQLGIRLALDDFGTGHSSLNVLQELPLDTLKIDRTFIANAGDAVRRYGAIIATITELAKNLDMQVIAEGIERREQVALLKSLRCDFAQGWLFSRGVSDEDARAMLVSDRVFDTAA
jgi:diguanylate cyclase (GGDEF)-like protein